MRADTRYGANAPHNGSITCISGPSANRPRFSSLAQSGRGTLISLGEEGGRAAPSSYIYEAVGRAMNGESYELWPRSLFLRAAESLDLARATYSGEPPRRGGNECARPEPARALLILKSDFFAPVFETIPLCFYACALFRTMLRLLFCEWDNSSFN